MEPYSDKYFLNMCTEFATRSSDPSTQNGALIWNHLFYGPDNVVAGWNEFPGHVALTEERQQRPIKYFYYEHAERGAVYRAARYGYRTQGATMYCLWAACHDCARAIICAGISKLVRIYEQDLHTNPRWGESCKISDNMLLEAGVKIINIEGKIGEIEIRRDGKIITP